MIRRKSSKGLRRSTAEVEEDVNPNSYITNLADCMLVAIVGLLVALVTYYNVDLQNEQQPIIGHEVNMDIDGDGLVDEETYSESGKVYQDKETGQYYLVQE